MLLPGVFISSLLFTIDLHTVAYYHTINIFPPQSNHYTSLDISILHGPDYGTIITPSSQELKASSHHKNLHRPHLPPTTTHETHNNAFQPLLPLDEHLQRLIRHILNQHNLINIILVQTTTKEHFYPYILDYQ
jgi:hypothetical protein